MEDHQDWIRLGTCVGPDGKFVYGIHEPHFHTINLREEDLVLVLGRTHQGQLQKNSPNFPSGDVDEPSAGPIYEIANPFPFRGTTYIGKGWADEKAADPTRIVIATPMKVSLARAAKNIAWPDSDKVQSLIGALPEPIRLALATTSTDPNDLKLLAESSCRFVFDDRTGLPTGVAFAPDEKGRMRPQIYNHRLYEAVANNPYLDEVYKEVMVLRPGIQGGSEIVGEWRQGASHVYEYLRRNSYIPWGHFAANMAQDSIRYAVGHLCPDDIQGMRHLYYQRTYVRLARELNLDPPVQRKMLSIESLENLRRDEIISSVIEYMRPHHPETTDNSPGKMGIEEWKVWDIPSINARLDLSVVVSEEHDNAYNVTGAWFYYMENTPEEDLKPFRDALKKNGFNDSGHM